jgi:aspartate kinase
MIVMKFGGTSVQDATAIRNAAQLVAKETSRPPLVVVSACAGVTNALIGIAKKSANGETDAALAALRALHDRHRKIADELFADETHRQQADSPWSAVQASFAKDFGALERLAQSLSVLGELTLRALDQLTAHGELWSSLLLSHELRQHGTNTCWVDARGVLLTSNEFTHAAPLFELTEQKSRERILPHLQRGTVVVTQGFIGATQEGITTTIGRGGSDYSAAIFGALLDAEEIQIWTDVDGILTADPSIIPKAQSIEHMTFNEAAELAYFGAKVLHPSTILPAVQKNIPVKVLNSKNPASGGTLITRESKNGSQRVVKSIAYKEHITAITVQSTRMLMAHGFLAHIFNVFAAHKKSIDVIATSEVGVSLTVDDKSDLEALIAEISQCAEVKVEYNRAVICIVGEKIKFDRGIAARVFAALDRAEVNVELISQGGSEINLTFVINESQIAVAVKCLHDEFFSKS